jgi:hypothetical protein
LILESLTEATMAMFKMDKQIVEEHDKETMEIIVKLVETRIMHAEHVHAHVVVVQIMVEVENLTLKILRRRKFHSENLKTN